MAVSDWSRLLRGQWITSIVGLVVTGGLTYATMSAVSVTYTSTAQIVLLPPRASTGNGTNPFLGMGGLENMAVVVSRSMADDVTAKAMADQGVSNKYSAAFDPSAGAPILIVSVDEPSPDKSRSSLSKVVDRVPENMSQLQASVRREFQITTAVIGTAGEPQAQWKNQLRAVIAVVVMGLSLTVLAASLMESWRRKREAAMHRKAGTAASALPMDDGTVGIPVLSPAGAASRPADPAPPRRAPDGRS